MNNETFPGFPHPAAEIISYISRKDRFVITLRPKEVKTHRSRDEAAFRQWLAYHSIKDITGEVGTMITEIYFNGNIYNWDFDTPDATEPPKEPDTKPQTPDPTDELPRPNP